MRIFLGIDGGQSSTTCLVGDEDGRVRGVGRAGPSTHAHAVGHSTQAALQNADLALDTGFAAACVGLSGGAAGREALVRETIRAEEYLITHDAMIALAGATAGSAGLVTIAGTGSIAFGKNAAGKTARAGGWGYLFGDEGGAFDLVRQALRAALRHEEGWGPATALREKLLAAKDAPDVNHLMHRFYSDAYPRDHIAALAPLVDEAAREGDVIAREILNQAAQSLASITAAVRGQLFDDAEAVDVRYIGGVFRAPSLLARYTMLVEMGGNCRVSAPRYGPAAGALLEAYRLAGVECTLKNVPEE